MTLILPRPLSSYTSCCLSPGTYHCTSLHLTTFKTLVKACSRKHFDCLNSLKTVANNNGFPWGIPNRSWLQRHDLQKFYVKCKILWYQPLDLKRSHSQRVLTDASQKQNTLRKHSLCKLSNLNSETHLRAEQKASIIFQLKHYCPQLRHLPNFKKA